MEVRTRFAPSPTGHLHIGSLRTALYAYAFAKNRQGVFILRLEDTDRARLVAGAAEKIYEQLKIFGIAWDEGPLVGGPHAPYIQSERAALGIYKKYAEQLIATGHAYYCFCPPQTKEETQKTHPVGTGALRDERCRGISIDEAKSRLAGGEKAAVRLRIPDNETIKFSDFVVKKEVSWNSRFVDETILLKSDGFPTYQLAVVVDDALMQVTHILRALEWLPSTPIHLLLFRYLGFPVPEIGHLTDILDPAGGKLSKRKGNVSTEDFLGAGYLPEAILNCIMLLGWAPKDNREMFTLEEFVRNFTVDGLQKANPQFNQAKLNWFNQQYIKKLANEQLAEKLSRFTQHSSAEIKNLIPLIRDRLVTLADFDALTSYFFTRPAPVLHQAIAKYRSGSEILNHATAILRESFDGKILEEKARQFCAEKNLKVGDYFMVLRLAVTGSSATPPLWEIMKVLGSSETLARLGAAHHC
jgi:glutamyl-tRNA synthetase